MQTFRKYLTVFCLAAGIVSAPRYASAQLLSADPPKGATSLPVMQVVLTPWGPWPQSISWPTGPFILAVKPHWKALSDTYSLQLAASPTGGGGTAGASATPASALVQFPATARAKVDFQQINLQPGQYEMTFSEHPTWRVAITITAVAP